MDNKSIFSIINKGFGYFLSITGENGGFEKPN